MLYNSFRLFYMPMRKRQNDMVEFISLKQQNSIYASEYEEALLRAARSRWYILGNIENVATPVFMELDEMFCLNAKK